MVGYSIQMAADEAGTLERLKGIRKHIVEPQVAAHDGRIVKEVGDGLLIEFASAVSAVECAVQMQLRLAETNLAEEDDRKATFRIGINIGELIVEGDDIYGDSVNIAARLESLAKPNDIYLSLTA